jgi:hypothetical protein
MIDAITPFSLAIPQAELDDLRPRPDRTRWLAAHWISPTAVEA